MPPFDLATLREAATLVHRTVPPTPTHAWPLLAARTGCEVFIKHENHTPTGAFKVRGGVTYLRGLMRSGAKPAGLISATRGNHGQSIALAASQAGIAATIVVPEGNSVEKNAAMQAFGARLIVTGRDFDEARGQAQLIAARENLHFVPSFHPDLILGVATYALEMFESAPGLDTVYVPIGMGSGICAVIAARDLLGLSTKIIGVVSDRAPAVKLSFDSGNIVTTESALTFADGMACRSPVPEAMAIIKAGAERIVAVSDDQVAQAIRVLYTDTHNLAEGAGAAATAALLAEASRYQGKRMAAVLCGGNIDQAWFAKILHGETPVV